MLCMRTLAFKPNLLSMRHGLKILKLHEILSGYLCKHLQELFHIILEVLSCE